MLVPFMRRPNKKRGGGCVCVFWYLTHFRTLFPLWIPSLGHSLPLLCWASSDYLFHEENYTWIEIDLSAIDGNGWWNLFDFISISLSLGKPQFFISTRWHVVQFLAHSLASVPSQNLVSYFHNFWVLIFTIFDFIFPQFFISFFHNFWFHISTLLSFLILCRFVQIARVVFSCILGVRDALKYIFKYYVCWINLDYL